MKLWQYMTIVAFAVVVIVSSLLFFLLKEEEIIRMETAASSFSAHSSNRNLFFTTVSIVTKNEKKQPLHGLGRQNFSITESYAGVTRNATILSVRSIGKNPTTPVSHEEDIEVLMVVDSSGSMGDDSGDRRTKLERTLSAAIVLAQRIFLIDTVRTRVGILTFPNMYYDKAQITSLKSRRSMLWHSNLESLKKILNLAIPRGNTPLWDSILEAVVVTQPSKGYRAVVVLTDGMDNASKASFAETLERIDRSNTPIFTVYYGTEHDTARLAQLSQLSGAGGIGAGSYVNATPDSLKGIFSSIGGLISDAYEIAYEPTGAQVGTQVQVEMRIVYKTKFGRRHEIAERQQYTAQ